MTDATRETESNEGHCYPDDRPSLLAEVSPPTYEMIYNWMKDTPGRAVSFDIWARGNYVRRLIHAVSRPDPPLLIPVSRPDEMRWAYRRLALLGLPIDFLYVGGVTEPKKILQLYPADGTVNDGGWGYIGALGSIAKIRGRPWFPVIGYSRLMPEPILDWITVEAGEAFLRGDVFVAPAELVGIDPIARDLGAQALAEVTLGARLESSMQAVSLLMELELPYLEGMPPSRFDAFLEDHEEDLVPFRAAIRWLVKGDSKDIAELVEDIRVQVAELSRSAKHQGMRRNASKLGGGLATFAAALAASAAASPEMLLTVAGVAVATGATATLVEFWKQRAEDTAKLAENPFYLLWNLGVTKPSQVQRSHLNVGFRKHQRRLPAGGGARFDCHWMCPPTPGLRFGAFRKSRQ